MKSSTYYRSVLFLPYLTIIPAFLMAKDFLANPNEGTLLGAQFVGTSWIVLSGFWIVPYTIVVVGLLIWSKGKSSSRIRSLLLRSPLILMMVMAIVFLLFGLLGLYSSDPDARGFSAGVALLGPICSAPFSLVVGYVFVVIGLLLYEILDKFGYIRDDIQS